MEIRTLKYIVAIADCKSLTKAADTLYVGQPTLSKCLAAVERELGLALFRKVGHTYVPTYAGERLIERAREILRLSGELDTEMASILNQNEGELNIAFANMRCSYLLPAILPVFQSRFPRVKVHVFEGSSDENDLRLLDGRVEIAFYTEPSEANSLLEYTPLAREELLICACAASPLKHLAQSSPDGLYPFLELSDLRNERIIMMRPEQRTRQIVDSILREKGLRFDNVLYSSNIQAIMGLVAAGYGISFVFDSHLKHLHEGAPFECFRIAGARSVYSFVGATRKGVPLSRYGKDLIGIVHSVI